MSAETFVARLDRVPLNRFHWTLLITSGLGWMFDAMDVLLIGFLVTPITKEFALAPAQVGLVASAGFVGMFLGAAISGRLADRYGRRLIFQATLVLFSIGAVLSALAPTFELLLAARVVAGLGLGGELPVVATLVSEFSPRAQRGRMIVLLESFWAYGTLAAGLVALLVLPQFGWRGAFVVAALPALYVAYLRSALPESPRYLAERGRGAEADAIVRRVERAGGGALLTLGAAVAPARSGRTSLAELWKPAYARRTAMLWILWFGITFTYYGIFLYVPPRGWSSAGVVSRRSSRTCSAPRPQRSCSGTPAPAPMHSYTPRCSRSSISALGAWFTRSPRSSTRRPCVRQAPVSPPRSDVPAGSSARS